MKNLYNKVCEKCSQMVTQKYSTSFSLGIKLLDKKLHAPIYGIYGFVRLADEIVDTFHEAPQRDLLDHFKQQTREAIDLKISTNPILQSFQRTVHQYHIDWELIDKFFNSMYMDLEPIDYDQTAYEEYILGSAEVVGLMCLKVFVEGNEAQYEELKPAAMKLGSVFQKVNFLRDIQHDYENLGRVYFPNFDIENMQNEQLQEILSDIRYEFDESFEGIKKLPKSSKFGVYLAYRYYRKLFNRIERTSAKRIMKERVRIPNPIKYSILVRSFVRHQIGWY